MPYATLIIDFGILVLILTVSIISVPEVKTFILIYVVFIIPCSMIDIYAFSGLML